MKRLSPCWALMLLTACGDSQEACDFRSPSFPTSSQATPDPSKTIVPTEAFGPGKFAYVNSDPPPGGAISGCGDAVGGCQERLKVVFGLRPDVDLRSQRLHVIFVSATEGVLDCYSSAFDLQAGETFSIQVACPSSPGGAVTPFTTATMKVETGFGAQRIEQSWKATYTFLP